MENPVQMGTLWTIRHAMEGFMASMGIDFYEDWINGKLTDPNDPKIKKAIDVLEKYIDYANPDYINLSWNEATKRVIEGEGAFNIMGDWNNGEFKSANMIYNVDYGTFPVPGTEDMYAIVTDTFQRPKGSMHPESLKKWLKVVASKEGQDAFNPLKGSISARLDTETEKYDEYQKSAIKDFWSVRYMYPSISYGSPKSLDNEMINIIEDFIKNRDKEETAKKIAEIGLKNKSEFTKEWILQ